MKIAQIKTSLTSAVLQPDGSYVFGNCKPGRGQCGEYTNDTLNLQGVNRAGDTLASKCDAPDFVLVANGGMPTVGGYFVMKAALPYGHIGVIRRVLYLPGGGTVHGFDFTDYNWDSHEGRRDGFIAVGDKNWKLIVGFGIGNPVIEFAPVNFEPEKKIISGVYESLERIDDPRAREAQYHLKMANDALRKS